MSGHGGIQTLFVLGVALSIPIVWVALGELIGEQAGIINIGVEGVMLNSALGSALIYQKVPDFTVALLAGAGSGLLCGVVLGYFYVVRGMNQIVTGILFNIFAAGLTAAIYNNVGALASSLGRTLPDVKIPGLSEIPWVGPVLFSQTALAYIAVVAVVLVTLLLRRTWFGLYIRAAGERPTVVESTGENVLRLRFVAVLIGSVFAGVGGAVLILSSSGGFNLNITAGSGYIALAVLVVARWKPLAVMLLCFCFGIAQAFQFQVNQLGVLGRLPPEFWQAVPYLATILALAIARGSRYPDACGVPYLRARAGSALAPRARAVAAMLGVRARPPRAVIVPVDHDG